MTILPTLTHLRSFTEPLLAAGPGSAALRHLLVQQDQETQQQVSLMSPEEL